MEYNKGSGPNGLVMVRKKESEISLMEKEIVYGPPGIKMAIKNYKPPT